MTQYLKRICWHTCMLLTALVAVYGFVPTAYAQQAAGSGVGVQAQSQSCTTQIETVEDRLRDARELIAKIKDCNKQEKVLVDAASGDCAYPDELSHSWSGTRLTIDGDNIGEGDLKGARGDKGPDAPACPSGTCECDDMSCSNCIPDEPGDGGGRNNCCAIHGEGWRQCGKDSCCHALYSSKYTPGCSVGGPELLPCGNPKPRCGGPTASRECPIRVCERVPNPNDSETAICVYAAANQYCP